MIKWAVMLILRQLLGSYETKHRVFTALRQAAEGTDTKLDNEAVDVVEKVWDVVIPILIGKMK